MLVGQNISVFQAAEVQTFGGSKLSNWWWIWMRTFILFVKTPQIFFKPTEASEHISPFPYPEWTCELVGRCLGSGHFNSFGCILTFSLEEFLLVFFMLFIKLLFCSFRPFLCVEWENHFIWWNLHFRNGEQWLLFPRMYHAKTQSPNILELCVVWLVGEIHVDLDFSSASDFALYIGWGDTKAWCSASEIFMGSCKTQTVLGFFPLNLGVFWRRTDEEECLLLP